MLYVAHEKAHNQRAGSVEEKQWSFVLSHWQGVHEVRYSDIPDECYLVVMSPRGSRYVVADAPLTEFLHKQEPICYVFGSDHHHLTLDELPREPDEVLYIPTDGYAEMHSWVACAITLYDRAVKLG